MSDDEQDELFTSVSNIIEAAGDTIATEHFSDTLRNIGTILMTFRAFMTAGGFSDEWAEMACTSLWNTFFPGSTIEADE